MTRFSRQWFLAVHLPVPLVIGLRRWRTAGALVLAGTLAVGASSCGKSRQPAPGAKDAPGSVIAANADPESLFTALEARLLGARTIDVEYDITSEGSIPSSVQGMLTVATGNRAHMSPAGTFMGMPVDIAIVSDGTRLSSRRDSTIVEGATPLFLNEAIVIGLTRMGHLHNIAVLTGGLLPDHSDGGAADWVRPANFARSDSVASPDSTWVTVAFDIFIADRNVAHATLWLDPATGLPAGRAQTVYFPSGAMRARETYSRFSVDGEVPPERFDPAH